MRGAALRVGDVGGDRDRHRADVRRRTRSANAIRQTPASAANKVPARLSNIREERDALGRSLSVAADQIEERVAHHRKAQDV